MPLDPLVSLAVSLAEGPADTTFFLGSGVSRDAGIPTGGEVFWLGVADWFRAQNNVELAPNRAELQRWLAEQGYENLTYSSLLELLCPDQPTRRDYLARHFEGVEPGETHRRLAQLAADGLVKIFISTNFDRLLERALEEVGVVPILVTDGPDIERAPSREHASCYVIKPHGDYLQQNIRNTETELSELDPRMTSELAEVFDRCGVVILGYSGNDVAIGKLFQQRNSRYGLYWVTRSDLEPGAQAIVETQFGRVIRRPDAATLVRDLGQMIASYQAHPTGQTPVVVHDEVLALIRAGDTVGLNERLRNERHAFESAITEAFADSARVTPDAVHVVAMHGTLVEVLERRLAGLIPLALHANELFDREVRLLADFQSRMSERPGNGPWDELRGWCFWWLTQALGAVLMSEQRVEKLRPIFAARVALPYGKEEQLAQSLTVQDAFGTMVLKQRDLPPTAEPVWRLLRLTMEESSLLLGRYPALVSSTAELDRALVEYALVLSIMLGLHDERDWGRWRPRGEASDSFARRLVASGSLRRDVAEAVGLDLVEFDAVAASNLSKAVNNQLTLGGWPSDAVEILRALEPKPAVEPHQ